MVATTTTFQKPKARYRLKGNAVPPPAEAFAQAKAEARAAAGLAPSTSPADGPSSPSGSSPFSEPVQYPPAREAPTGANPAPSAPGGGAPPPPPEADRAAPAGTPSTPSEAPSDEDGGAAAAAAEGKEEKPKKPKTSAEEKAERNRREKAADGYAKMFSAFDQELVRILLWDRMSPAELADTLERHALDPDIAAAISFSIEQVLEEHPGLAGSGGAIGLIVTFYALRMGDTIKKRVDLNNLEEAEIRQLRTERQRYAQAKQQEREVQAETVRVDPRGREPGEPSRR
jgi:hypothetical protein